MYQEIEFEGPFKDELIGFVEHKRSLGYDYGKTMTSRLVALNRFFIQQGITDIQIPADVYLDWIQLKNNESTSNQQKRYCAIHGFARFLISRGYSDVHDTENPVLQRKDFVPYIYTEDEIQQIFKCADNYQCRHSSTVFNHGRMIPVLLRLLYSTGMRISETLSLRQCDIDVERGVVLLLHGKNHEGRRIIVSSSMRGVLEYYLRETGSCDDYAYLFRGCDGRVYTVDMARRTFHRILDKAGIHRRPSGNYPRLHDFRHLFAIRALEQMVENGYDLYTSLPMLCKYLGHKSITETEYYIRLTRNRFAHLTNASVKHAPHLFPEIEEHAYE